MGKEEYLWRMALGRSAFAALDQDDAIHANTSTSGSIQSHSAATQQYNAQGKPINPLKEKQDEERRNAQNQVLAAAGVVQATPSAAVPRVSALTAEHSSMATQSAVEQSDIFSDIYNFIATSILTW